MEHSRHFHCDRKAESSKAYNSEHDKEMVSEENNSASISSIDSASNARISPEQLRVDELKE